MPGVPVTNWDETNGAFDFSAPFLTASANSDAGDVPEPASLRADRIGYRRLHWPAPGVIAFFAPNHPWTHTPPLGHSRAAVFILP